MLHNSVAVYTEAQDLDVLPLESLDLTSQFQQLSRTGP